MNILTNMKAKKLVKSLLSSFRKNEGFVWNITKQIPEEQFEDMVDYAETFIPDLVCIPLFENTEDGKDVWFAVFGKNPADAWNTFQQVVLTFREPELEEEDTDRGISLVSSPWESIQTMASVIKHKMEKDFDIQLPWLLDRDPKDASRVLN